MTNPVRLTEAQIGVLTSRASSAPCLLSIKASNTSNSCLFSFSARSETRDPPASW